VDEATRFHNEAQNPNVLVLFPCSLFQNVIGHGQQPKQAHLLVHRRRVIASIDYIIIRLEAAEFSLNTGLALKKWRPQ